MTQPKSVQKRDTQFSEFDISKIKKAINSAFINNKNYLETDEREKIEEIVTAITNNVGNRLIELDTEYVHIEVIQDYVVEEILRCGYPIISDLYEKYRKERAYSRSSFVERSIKEIDGYLEKTNWNVKENSNMRYSLQGLNIALSTDSSKEYWLNKVYNKEVANAHYDKDMHIHDLYLLSAYCVGWDLKDLLKVGFTGVPGKITSKPAKHFNIALNHIFNFIFTLQGEAAGAEALSNFDTLLAPFIYYDGLNEQDVKRALESFLFNMNVPTRVGFQCLSDDTDILTPDGWKSMYMVQVGDTIKTFNMDTHFIEDMPVKQVFIDDYTGDMYNLKNRSQDQLVSPQHNVVRKKFNTDNYCLERIEETIKFQSPIQVPISALNENKEIDIADYKLQFMAMIISDGSLEKDGNSRRITLYVPDMHQEKSIENSLDLINKVGLKCTYKEYEPVLGRIPIYRIRFNSENTKKILEWFQDDEIKIIPKQLLNMSVRQSRVFIESYRMIGDGEVDRPRISTTHKTINDGLQQIIINAGWGSASKIIPSHPDIIRRKELYLISIIGQNNTTHDTQINVIYKVPYSGKIWCPSTDNGTIIARRNGKVFITGNCPFSNITLDLVCPKHMKDEPVIVGGEYKSKTYGEFQKEMDMLNIAFAEIMTKGDGAGQLFSFPIPTYCIDDSFDWDNPNYKPIWEMTAKYGIPYFANYVNSDLSKEDSRSMCCRLRLDLTQLHKRGGGLFGANALTGSMGVVTINLPRIGHSAISKEDYFNKLNKVADIAKDSLLAKADFIENLTEKGLYPYTSFYLRAVEEQTGKYWTNHFLTIGIIGAHESCLNFLGKGIDTEEGHSFAIEIMDFLNKKVIEYQKEYNKLFNLEASPAEGLSYSFYRTDKAKYPDMKCFSMENKLFYTNSTALPVDTNLDLFSALNHQDPLQTRYTGGTVYHVFLGERISDPNAVKTLVKKILYSYKIPYISLSPSFSICRNHGYLIGEQEICPMCGEKNLIYSRSVGYIRNTSDWHEGKQDEFRLRKRFDKDIK